MHTCWFINLKFCECSGLVTFRYGPGSVDPYYWITDPDPALFFGSLPDVNKKSLVSRFVCWSLIISKFISVFKHNKSENRMAEIKVFLNIVFVDGRIRNRGRNRTNINGSGRSKNLQALRIWIRNTECCRRKVRIRLEMDCSSAAGNSGRLVVQWILSIRKMCYIKHI